MSCACTCNPCNCNPCSCKEDFSKVAAGSPESPASVAPVTVKAPARKPK